MFILNFAILLGMSCLLCRLHGAVVDTAIIGAGNSGVGKSCLLNVALNRNEFHHDETPDSVTDKCEFVTTTMFFGGSEKPVGVFNIPGLIEVNPDNLKRNKKAMELAFTSSEKQVVFFVFGNEGGRPRSEDVHAFLAMQKAFEIDMSSLLFVFNKRPASFTEESENRFIALVKQALKWDDNVRFNGVFIDKMDGCLESPKAAENREKLLVAIQQLVPKHHAKKAEITFNSDEIIAMTSTIRGLEKKMKDDKSLHEQELRASQELQKHWQRRASEIRANRGFSIGLGPISLKVDL